MPGAFYIEGKKEKLDIGAILAAVSETLDKLRILVVFRGETTAAGAVDGSTLVCDDLAAQPDFDGHIVVILSGDYAGQSRGINGTTLGGTAPVSPVFGGQIVAGIQFAILSTREVEIDLGPIKDQTDKLAGEDPVTGSTTAEWNAGESDVVSIGAAGVRYKVHSLLLSIHNLVGDDITVRLYMEVNGVERIVYEQSFNAATDPPGLWVINGTLGIHDVLRVTLESNAAGDDNEAVDYDYMLEAMS